MTVKDFVLKKLDKRNFHYLETNYPELVERINGDFADTEFAELLDNEDEGAFLTFWFILHSEYAGWAITNGYGKTQGRGCKTHCGHYKNAPRCELIKNLLRPSPLFFIEQEEKKNGDDVTCGWLPKIQSIIEERLMQVKYNPGYGFVDWFLMQIGKIQYAMLQEYKMKPPDKAHLPVAIKRLMAEDLTHARIYQEIFNYRWFYDNPNIDGLFKYLRQRCQIETGIQFHDFVKRVDDKFMASREFNNWRRKFREFKIRRRDAGIPFFYNLRVI